MLICRNISAPRMGARAARTAMERMIISLLLTHKEVLMTPPRRILLSFQTHTPSFPCNGFLWRTMVYTLLPPPTTR